MRRIVGAKRLKEYEHLHSEEAYRIKKDILRIISEKVEGDKPEYTNCAKLHRVIHKAYPRAKMIITPDFHVMTLVDETFYDYRGEVGTIMDRSEQFFGNSFGWPEFNNGCYE